MGVRLDKLDVFPDSITPQELAEHLRAGGDAKVVPCKHKWRRVKDLVYRFRYSKCRYCGLTKRVGE